MASHSLNKHIFRLSSSLVLLCILATLAITWLAVVEHTKQQLTNNFKVAESVIREVLASQETQLFNQAKILTYALGITKESKEHIIGGTSNNPGELSEADVIALITPEGLVRHSTFEALWADSPFPYPALLEQAKLEGLARYWCSMKKFINYCCCWWMSLTSQ